MCSNITNLFEKGYLFLLIITGHKCLLDHIEPGYIISSFYDIMVDGKENERSTMKYNMKYYTHDNMDITIEFILANNKNLNFLFEMKFTREKFHLNKLTVYGDDGFEIVYEVNNDIQNVLYEIALVLKIDENNYDEKQRDEINNVLNCFSKSIIKN